MANQVQLTTETVDLVVNAVAQRLLKDAGRIEVSSDALCSAFRNFAEGIAILTESPSRGPAEETAE